jgi:hypothetical protein
LDTDLYNFSLFAVLLLLFYPYSYYIRFSNIVKLFLRISLALVMISKYPSYYKRKMDKLIN